jgi:hypothetical protein
MTRRFFIEQVALCPKDPKAAIELLKALGLEAWAHDTVVAAGKVYGEERTNVAALAFNYQASRGLGDNFLGDSFLDSDARPIELEVLHYRAGNNWMEERPPSVSHIGMHCTESELEEWRRLLRSMGYCVAQEVFTESHTNPVIAGKRLYHYVIFDTRDVLGVDLKFIVRREVG